MDTNICFYSKHSPKHSPNIQIVTIKSSIEKHCMMIRVVNTMQACTKVQLRERDAPPQPRPYKQSPITTAHFVEYAPNDSDCEAVAEEPDKSCPTNPCYRPWSRRLGLPPPGQLYRQQHFEHPMAIRPRSPRHEDQRLPPAA
ncbi:hypothetical protein E4U55_007510 [Claviceps digitariae]|nr:hypothetical protein E4U55_007510 [Claviceps digitariae]